MSKVIRLRPGAQGDILIIPISAIPANAKAAVPAGKNYIIAHSETGHHHVIDRARAEVYEAADNEFIAYIRTLGAGAEITHERPFDTHESVALEPNSLYEVRRQREYVAEGFRRAQD